jgi:hypothetical protein
MLATQTNREPLVALPALALQALNKKASHPSEEV